MSPLTDCAFFTARNAPLVCKVECKVYQLGELCCASDRNS